MIKTLVKIDNQALQPVEQPLAPEITPAKPDDTTNVDGILVDLKARLNALINYGHNQPDLEVLKASLLATITDLEKMRDDPTIDQLSSGSIL